MVRSLVSMWVCMIGSRSSKLVLNWLLLILASSTGLVTLIAASLFVNFASLTWSLCSRRRSGLSLLLSAVASSCLPISVVILPFPRGSEGD